MNLILRGLFLIIATVMAATVASPALAAGKPAPTVEWTLSEVSARAAATVNVGDSVNLLAKFPKACRNRDVVLKANGVVLITMNTGSMKSFAYSMAGYVPGTTTYTFSAKRTAKCAGVKSSFDLEVR